MNEESKPIDDARFMIALSEAVASGKISVQVLLFALANAVSTGEVDGQDLLDVLVKATENQSEDSFGSIEAHASLILDLSPDALSGAYSKVTEEYGGKYMGNVFNALLKAIVTNYKDGDAEIVCTSLGVITRSNAENDRVKIPNDEKFKHALAIFCASLENFYRRNFIEDDS